MKTLYQITKLAIIFLASSHGLSMTSSDAAESKKVIMFINLMKNDSALLPHRILHFRYAQKMQRLYPQRRIIFIEERTAPKFKLVLSNAFFEDETISHVFLSAHGNSLSVHDQECINIYIGDEAVLMQILNGKESHVNAASREVFDILGARLDDAIVTLMACNLLSGNPESAQKKAQLCANLMGLKNGQLFATKDSFTCLPFFSKSRVITDPFAYKAIASLFIFSSLRLCKLCFSLEKVKLSKRAASFYLGIGCLPVGKILWKNSLDSNEGYQCKVVDSQITEMIPTNYNSFTRAQLGADEEFKSEEFWP